MSDQRIIFTRPDGGVSVIIPAPGVPMARVLQDVPADAVAPTVVPVEDIPTDRTFRAAWKLDGRRCVECPAKSKEIAHEIRRARRAAEFAPLDAEIAKQIPGKDAQAVEAQRQAIRAKYERVQSDVDACASVDDLRAIVKAL